ncbi:MAG: hypothetical protein HUJ63_11875 [Enterococcus sp.]|nr:hypothetical protein [Enterococcus sp.]
MAKKKSKAPKSLDCYRSGNAFVFSWKNSSDDYEHIQIKFKVNTKGGTLSYAEPAGKSGIEVGKKRDYYVLRLNKNDLFPETGTILTSIDFWVRARKKNELFCDWQHHKWKSKKLKKPTGFAYALNSLEDRYTVGWKTKFSDTSDRWATKTRIQSCLVEEKSTPNWNLANNWTYRTGESPTYSNTESTKILNEGSHTRFFRIQQVGPTGSSAYLTGKHVYCNTPSATIRSANGSKKGGGWNIDVSWTYRDTKLYPVNIVTLQYLISQPVIEKSTDPTTGKIIYDILPPTGASWSNAIQFVDNKKDKLLSGIGRFGSEKEKISGGKSSQFVISIDGTVSDDNVIFVRANTMHDFESFGKSKLVVGSQGGYAIYRISTPTMDPPEITGTTMQLNVDHVTPLTNTHMLVKLKRGSESGSGTVHNLGIIDNPTTTGTFTVDLSEETSFQVGIQNFVGTYEIIDGECTVDKTLYSDTYWYKSGDMPVAPSDVKASLDGNDIFVTWTNRWDKCTGETISWSTNPRAWDSTDSPNEYEIGEKRNSFYICGVDTGVVYYIRVKANQNLGGDSISSGWSELTSNSTLDLASAPVIPTLTLDKDAVEPTGQFTASWAYISTDGTDQESGIIVEAKSDEEGNYNPVLDGDGNPVVLTTASSSRSVVMSVEDVNNVYETTGMTDYIWNDGTTHYLMCKVTSQSGIQSDDWSDITPITVISPPVATIVSSSFSQTAKVYSTALGNGETTEFELKYEIDTVYSVKINGVSTTAWTTSENKIIFSVPPSEGANIEIEWNAMMPEGLKALTSLPLTLELSGAGSGGYTNVAITRTRDFDALNPIELPGGQEGEVVANLSNVGDGTFQITLNDILGRLDDSAPYTLTYTVQDEYGQVDSETQEFFVYWDHQAEIPVATISLEDNVVMIEVEKSSTWSDGDTVDIYRISKDDEEKIISNGEIKKEELTTTFVDPYPTNDCSYRVVYVSKDGDWTTPYNSAAWIDIDSGYKLSSIIINFDKQLVELPYNINLDNSWEKPFERTRYLGGSIQGTWSEGVTRDLTATSVTAKYDDQGLIFQMRELANYPGICHVRTPDGSSFAANVSVSETQNYDSMTVDFSLSIQKVDHQNVDGMTLDAWNAQKEE